MEGYRQRPEVKSEAHSDRLAARAEVYLNAATELIAGRRWSVEAIFEELTDLRDQGRENLPASTVSALDTALHSVHRSAITNVLEGLSRGKFQNAKEWQNFGISLAQDALDRDMITREEYDQFMLKLGEAPTASHS
jgi:hypothetical protein